MIKKIPNIMISLAASPLVQRLWLPLVFVIVLAANLVHHFLFNHPQAVFAYDGHFYYVTCALIVNYIGAALHGHLTWGMLRDPWFVWNITTNGPIVTGLPAIMLAWLGRPLSQTDWPLFIILFSIIQSISACLVSIICRKISDNIWIGLLFGMLFGLYPPSLVCTGLYMSEVIVIFLELLFVFLLSLPTNNLAIAIITGIAGAMLWLSKPALIPVVVLAIIIAAWKSPKKLSFTFSVFTALALCIILWASYTHKACGSTFITVNRWGSCNAVAGNDLNTDGWGVYPLTEFQKTDIPSPSKTIISQWTKAPLPMLLLTIKKFGRLYAYPWNTYRETVFGITAKWQQYIHIALLFLCLFGIYISLLSEKLPNIQGRLLWRLSLVMILGHFVYLMFQGIGRYAYTAIPFFLICSSYGLSLIRKSNFTHKILPCVIFALISIIFVTQSESLAAIWEPLQTVHIINPRTSIQKYINLTKASVNSNASQALLLIDSNNQLTDSQINVNGHLYQEKVHLLNSFGSEQYKFLYNFRSQSRLMNASIFDFRQWRVIPIPINWLNLHGNNLVTITAGANPFEIYGDSKETQNMPSPYYYATGIITTRMEGMELRANEYCFAQPMTQKSFINHTELSDSIRIRLALITPLRSNQGQSLGAIDHCILKLDLSKCHIFAQAPGCSGIQVSRYLLKQVGGIFNTINIPKLTPSSHIEFKITGEYRILDGPGHVSISAYLLGDKNEEINLALLPNSMKGSSNWQHFELNDLLPMDTISSPLKQIKLGFWPLPWIDAKYGARQDCSAAEFKNIQITLICKDLPCLKEGNVCYY